jgi:hypothetical protein
MEGMDSAATRGLIAKRREVRSERHMFHYYRMVGWARERRHEQRQLAE